MQCSWEISFNWWNKQSSIQKIDINNAMKFIHGQFFTWNVAKAFDRKYPKSVLRILWDGDKRSQPFNWETKQTIENWRKEREIIRIESYTCLKDGLLRLKEVTLSCNSNFLNWKMVGKKKSSPVGRKSAPTADSLVCIHCHIRVGFSGSLPATEYEKHLSKLMIAID